MAAKATAATVPFALTRNVHTVRIAFATEPLPGDQSCPGNPEARVTVELPAPLGDREIVEGLAIGLDLADFID